MVGVKAPAAHSERNATKSVVYYCCEEWEVNLARTDCTEVKCYGKVPNIYGYGWITELLKNKSSEFTSHLKTRLSLGSIYALIALGYNMVHRVLGFINFAHLLVITLYLNWFK